MSDTGDNALLPIDQIICGDALEILRRFPDNSIDFVLTDPPFFISQEIKITRGKNSMKFQGKDISLDFGEWDRQWATFEEFMDFTYRWVDEIARILKPGRIFATYFDKDKINFISRHLQDKHNFKCKDYYAHCLSNPVPQARKVSWMSGWLIAGLWQKPGGKLVYNYQLGQAKNWDIYSITPRYSKKEGVRFHPTQKPIDAGKKFISYWTVAGDIVLDPFAGSGAFLVAAKQLNRHYIGIEIDRQFYEKAQARLNSINQWEVLFD